MIAVTPAKRHSQLVIYYYFQNHVKIGVKGKTSSLRHDKEIKLLKESSYLQEDESTVVPQFW